MIKDVPHLSILIVNYNTSDFISLILKAITHLNYYPTTVLIADNNSVKSDFKKLKSFEKQYSTLTIFRLNHNLKGSLAHGHALNFLCSKIKTPYFAILDSDATFLFKNWDKILINQLNEKIKIIGTEPSGEKPKDFPLMYAILLETKAFKNLNINFKPKNIQAQQDTGWELREKYLTAGYKGKIIKTKYTRHYKNGPFKQVICAEYYLEGHQSIFASHFGRGATLGAQKYRKGLLQYFYKLPIIGTFFLKRKGINEKKKWIDTCKKIIDVQIS